MSEMAQIINNLSHQYYVWEVFSDFVELSAISLSNAVDKTQFNSRESRYFEIIKKYKKEDLQKFPQLLAILVDGLGKARADILGALFHELELHNKYKGQYFTPYPLCRMMAKMTYPSDAKTLIQDKGFITVNEPACGSAAMIVALADEMSENGFNCQQHMHVTASDLDVRCVHMAYVQLSLLHIPAIIIHANTLSMEEYSYWYTPAHILSGWKHKLNCSVRDIYKKCEDDGCINIERVA